MKNSREGTGFYSVFVASCVAAGSVFVKLSFGDTWALLFCLWLIALILASIRYNEQQDNGE
jgi:hypothetical protein